MNEPMERSGVRYVQILQVETIPLPRAPCLMLLLQLNDHGRHGGYLQVFKIRDIQS